MDKFISIEKSSTTYDYFFNKNQFFLLLISLVIIIFFSMYLSRKKLKTQKIIGVVVGILLIILEFCRILWRYKYLIYNEENLSFVNVVNLDYFTLALWISIPIIIICSILKKDDYTKSTSLLNFVYSICALFAIISLIYPLNVNTYFPFYHCYNLIYVLQRSLVVMLSLTFILAKWISTYEFLDLWKALFCLIIFGVICIMLSVFIFKDNNLFYINYFPPFESLGVHLDFPLHLIVLGGFIFFLQIFIYCPFRIYKIIKEKRG